MTALVVTGASRGIGAEIARRAAATGRPVALNYNRSRAEAEEVVTSIRTAGGRALAVAADVSDPEQVEAMFAHIDRDLGPITGLVNNAGVNGSSGRVEALDPKATARLLSVNVLGPFLCAGAAIRRMARRHGGQGGVIVNISSAAARHGGPGSYVDYAASKGALDTFTIGLAREQASEGIRVNGLRPGATMTELSREWMRSHPDWESWVIGQVPLGRPARMEEIARAALFLLSEDASYITGAILDASGGWVSP
ncbi:MAG: SDR family oxidoreductase [Rhizobiales bacterium]|nr:SDR family oxidoreductase [Hyphomicrobiales bacterium]